MIAWISVFLSFILFFYTNLINDAKTAHVIHSGTIADDVFGLTIRSDRDVEYGRQIPYTEQEGDKLDKSGGHHRWVYRKGKLIGSLVGTEGKILHTLDRISGEPVDIKPAEKPSNWRITSPDDPNYPVDDGVHPEVIHRKSRPTDMIRTGAWKFDAPVEHNLYLKLPHKLQQGKHYTFTLNSTWLEPLEFTWDPVNQRSEAVHVNHLGFRPDDPAKVAFLSCWMGDGDGISYPEDITFRIIDDKSGKSVYRGLTTLSKAAEDKTEDAYNRNYNGTDVYEMDFTELQEPGLYRVFVEGVGCSYTFKIHEDVWRDAFIVSARGFYHQRSGISLGPPYTDFKRPRSFHPDDGLKVYASTASLMETGNGLNKEDSNFGNLVKGKTDELVQNAWGGYMDAGDWDRRIQHLEVTRLLLDLADIFPEYFSQLSLNIPESDDDLPDVVNEGLFNLDCYRRMQTPEGGIRGGIESSEHPRSGEASWQESLTVMAYAPGVWSSYLYAATAARAARWLETYKPELAREYQESALRAMRWAETQSYKISELPYHEVKDARNLAAAELWRLTGEAKWHDLYVKTTAFSDPNAETFVWQKHQQREAAWVYARTDNPLINAEIQKNCINALLREADQRADQCHKTGFRWAKYPWAPTGFGLLSSPDAVSLVRAHVITGDEKYLKAIVLACQTGAGANPVNICYTTGLGHKSPQHPLHIDSRISLQPPPPGLTVLGPIDLKTHNQAWAQNLVDQFCYPKGRDWPTLEAYWDVFWYPIICEFTVHQPMAANAYVWGYMAARQ
jgi:endoglucanase